MKRRNIFILFSILLFFTVLTFINCNTNYLDFIKSGFNNIYSFLASPFKYKCDYKIENYFNKELKNEINDLKKQLKLNSVISDFSYINSSVLYRNIDYWYNEITIDKGKNQNVNKEDAVISENGLIGKVTRVYSNSAVVSLIYNDLNPYGVSVYIDSEKKQYGVVKYDDGLVLTGIDDYSLLQKSDKVITSGLGGVFPSGIMVGYVDKVESNKNGIGKKIYIKSEADFNKIKYVMVLKRK